MATVYETMRNSLLNAPSIFPCPLAASIHWFAVIGNGMEWIDGELCYTSFREKSDKMRYDDLDEIEAHRMKFNLDYQYSLQDKSARVARKFVEEHIDDICKAPITLCLFDYRPTRYYYLTGICTQYATLFEVPENITLDWAIAVNDFIEQWQVALRREYGIGDLPDNISNVFDEFTRIRRITCPVIYGVDYDTHQATLARLAKQLIDEMLNEGE